MAITTASGTVEYDMGVTYAAIEAVSVAFDGSKHRLCINLICPTPQMVGATAECTGCAPVLLCTDTLQGGACG